MEVYQCPIEGCDYEGTFDSLNTHTRDHHLRQRGFGMRRRLNVYPFIEIKAFQGFLRTYRHRIDNSNIITPIAYMSKYKRQIKKIVKVNTKRGKGIRMQFTLVVEFFRGEIDTVEYEEIIRYENSSLKICYSVEDVDDLLDVVTSEILGYIEIFEQYGSGWQLKSILGLDIRLAKLPFIGGSCNVQLPKEINGKKCFVNVKNADNMCFKWAFLAMAHYNDIKKNKNRYVKYIQFEHLYDFSCISFPATIRQVDKFNKTLVKQKICVNIFGVEKIEEEYHFVLRRMSKHAVDQSFTKVNLLLYDDPEENNSHYIGITDISRMFGKKHRLKKEFCYNCMNTITKKRFAKHLEICTKFKTQKVHVPKDLSDFEKYIRFDRWEKLLPHEYVIYADLEALCIPTQDERPFTEKSYTYKYQKHNPSGYSYAVVRKNKVINYKVERDPNCIDNFFGEMYVEAKRIKLLQQDFLPMCELTDVENFSHDVTNICHICRRVITSTCMKVKDHDHSTGKYRGPAHYQCNAVYTNKKCRIPIVFHNFRKYDSHLLISGFEKYGDDIKVIPSNSENYMSIIFDDFILLDSLMFLNASLTTLVENLKKPEVNITYDNHFKNVFSPMIDVFGVEKSKILSRKGVYFYEYVKNFRQFNESKFPDQESFFNSLTKEHISDEDYQFGKYVFKNFCKTLGDYHDLYLLTDCLLLCCCMENFRKTVVKTFRLDPLHYFSLSGLAWDAALLKTGIALEKITCLEMYQFLESAMRGGVSMIVTREAKANNRYMQSYNRDEEQQFLCYFDVTNLYGTALLQSLPTGGFKWLKQEEVNKVTTETILNWKEDDNVGYICMVDLHYPPDLHVMHNDFPLMPEKIRIPHEGLSKYQKILLEKFDLKYSDKFSKLVPHLGDRTNYIVHYRNLKYYLNKGIILKKVHKVLQFNQSAWMDGYVLFCAQKRKEAKNAFERDIYKFFVNACFGKTIENLRKRRNIRIANDIRTVKLLMKKPTLKRFDILGENLAIFELEHISITLDRPVYIGYTVLELSKLLMYQIHYDRFKGHFGDRAQLLFTDTDSLSYSIKTPDLYQELWCFRDLMDFSDYPKDHYLCSDRNKKRLGSLKDEGAGKIFTHFVGLAAKMYSFQGEGIYKNAAKGIKKSVVKKSFRHSKFVKTLHRQQRHYAIMNVIRSYKHVLHTVEIKRIGLQSFDSKRYILPSGINTLAYNHFLLKPLKRLE